MMYQISAVCIACGGLHTMETTISLPVGPVNKQSIGEAYSNKDPPLQALKYVRVHCPKTGRHYTQRDVNKVFLVPLT
jgi:hypothetical protein